MLAQTMTSTQDAALFAEMLSLPNDARYPALELVPQQRRQRTLDALVSQMEALTRQRPVLMIIEATCLTCSPTRLRARDTLGQSWTVERQAMQPAIPAFSLSLNVT
jgi:hypothetical protein